jgi:ParB-like nuclease domain
MKSMDTGLFTMDAERAFTRATRARRRAALRRGLRRRRASEGRLCVLDPSHTARRMFRGVRALPLEAIKGTVEPGRTGLFDDGFRPRPAARRRWQGVWLAEQRGQALPPISVVQVDDGYAVLDGHHRVSVAHARGAVTIDAVVDAA